MTNTDPTPAASKPSGRNKQNATATQQLPEAPASTTTVAPATVAETRTGVGRGILIGAIAASLVGGLAIGGSAGALIAIAASHHRPGFSQAGQQGPFGHGGQHGQQGPGQQNGPGGPQGGMPGFPPQQGQDDGGQTQQDGTDSGDGSQ